jgi:hypothetical protein
VSEVVESSDRAYRLPPMRERFPVAFAVAATPDALPHIQGLGLRLGPSGV